MAMTAIAIIEAHRITRAGLEQAVAHSQRMRVVASVPAPADLDALGIRPDVTVLGPAASDSADPCAVIRALAERGPTLVVCASADTRAMLSALRYGASGLVSLDTEPDEFIAAVEAGARGGLYVAASLAAQLSTELKRHREGEPHGLARREVETLRLLAHGYTHGQIARRLGLTEATVNTYVKRIRVKLGAGNKAELTRMAVDLGYVEPRQVRPVLQPVAASGALSA